MTKEGSDKIVNFITIGAGGMMLGCRYVSHYSEYYLLLYITLIVIVLSEYNAAFLCHC